MLYLGLLTGRWWGHTAGTSCKIGIYFILINNWHIDVSWNISKTFIEYLFFVLFNTWFRYWIVWYFVSILCKFYISRIGVLDWHMYIVQGFDVKLLKLSSTALTFIWDPSSASMKLRMYQVILFSQIQDFVLKFEICTISLSSFGRWCTLMENKHQISLYLGLKKWPTFSR